MKESSDVAASLAGQREGVPERFVPEEMRGELVEAEHVARYWWATRFCEGLRVLDAGCGTGYGSAMIKEAGATEVVAVDNSEAIVEVARQGAPEGVVCETADVTSLPYRNDSFEAVVCFEVIEHVEQPETVLDELTRVLAPDGLLLISSPNRARYVPGNPHHRHEYLPGELGEALRSRFPAVRLLQQHVMIASVISGDDDDEELSEARVRRLASPEAEDEIYILAMAGERLPNPGSGAIALTKFVELRKWLEHYRQQVELLEQQRRALEELDTIRQDRQKALALLADRERAIAELTTLREDLRVANEETERMRRDLMAIEQRLQGAEGRIADMRASASWRATAPLRAAKRRVAIRRAP
jgi:SAM-dependent methyltransferase